MSRLTLDHVTTLAELKRAVDRLVEYTKDRNVDIPTDADIELHLTDDGMSLRIWGVGA